MQLWAV